MTTQWRLPRSTACAILVLGILCIPAILSADDDFEPRFHPSIHVTRANGPISIDGDLNDPGWRGAAVADGFAEVLPGDQVKPGVESKAMITYDDKNLYVALIARDNNPEEIRVSLRERDTIWRDDYFGIMLDTYGDGSWGYEFFVNPLGVQGDLRQQGNGDEDMAFDQIWESEGRVTQDGYQVEIAIPFASLRFPNKPVQTWRINFWRDHQRDVRRKYAWAAQNRDDPCFLCQLGRVTGIENISPGSNVDVIVSALAFQSGKLSDPDNPQTPFENDDADGEAALNIRYGFTSTSSAELALNPDFSQVESDAGQIDVNETFALFFPEKRPFFQEGSDLYDTWIDAVYTRSINDPDVAGKLFGQFGKTRLVYLYAEDKNSPQIIPFEERSRFLLLGESRSNIFRVRHTIHEDSYVGVLGTDRRLDGGGYGSVASVDANLRFFRNYSLEFQAVRSWTGEPDAPELTPGLDGEAFDRDGRSATFDGEEFTGHGLYVSLERHARRWSADFDYWEYSPTFQTDNGFTTGNDFRTVSLWTGLFDHTNGEWIIEWEPSINTGRKWKHDGQFKEKWVRPHIYVQMKGQLEIRSSLHMSSERFAEEVFDGIVVGRISMSSRFSEMLNLGGEWKLGKDIFRSFRAPELGNIRSYSLDATFKPVQQLVIQPDWTYSEMERRNGPGLLFKDYIIRTSVTYNFSREWYLRLITQYRDSRNRLDFEPLLTWKLNPFTVFFVGMSSSIRYFDDFTVETGTFRSFDDRRTIDYEDWRLTSRQFFAKLQYLYRF